MSDSSSANPGIHKQPLVFRGLVSISLIFILAGCGGCFDSDELKLMKSVPAPLADSYPYEVSSMMRLRFYGGDNFEVAEDLGEPVHYLLLQGADTPQVGQPFFEEACLALRRMTGGRKFRVVFLGRDDHCREIGRAFADDVDISLQLVKEGLACYDGTDFVDKADFAKAELAAREQRIGIWSEENPVRPPRF